MAIKVKTSIQRKAVNVLSVCVMDGGCLLSECEKFSLRKLSANKTLNEFKAITVV